MTEIYDLKCSGMIRPVGLDQKKPSFSWKLKSDRKDTFQSAYQIKVWDEEKMQVWDSGKIVSEKSNFIPYNGLELKEKWGYEWQVTIWDDAGETAVSDMSRFEMGYMDPAHWRGSFIGRQIPQNKEMGPDSDADLGQILVDMMTGNVWIFNRIGSWNR